MVVKFESRKVSSVSSLNEDTVWLQLEGNLVAQPGQFVMAWLPGIGEKPFSIASTTPFALLIVDVGPFSHTMQSVGIGDLVWFKGPLGQGFSINGEKLLLVGGGYGSAPLLPLVKQARAQNLQVDVCLGAKNQGGLLLVEAFETAGCKVSCATEDGSAGYHGLITDVVEGALQKFKYDALCACGPVGMLTALASLCQRYQVNYQLSWEAYMRCGMGLCGSCEMPVSYDSNLPSGWLACYDGPVFSHQWDQ